MKWSTPDRTQPAPVITIDDEPTSPGSDGRGAPGDRFGRYVGAQEIARGGMGAILRAHDPQIGRPVAIKILRRADRQGRFVREARITGQLVHPNIPPLHELGRTSDGEPFFVMKLIEGRSLEETLAGIRERGRPDDWPSTRRRLLTDFLKICDAVGFAHSRRIVHRDLKPSNVLIGEFGEVLVLDWGIAKELDRCETSSADEPAPATEGTVAGAVLGTPAYMSPEQAEGRTDRIDRRTDVYGLGGILYSILTLERPVQGSIVDLVLLNVVQGRVARFDGHRVPAELRAVVRKAMALDPADRYPTAADLREEIENHLGGYALEAARYTPLERVSKWIGRHRTASLAAALSGLVILGFLIALAAAALEARREADRAGLAREEAERSEAQARDALDDLGDAGLLSWLEAERLDAWRGFPDDVAGLEGWVERADRILERKAHHEQALTGLEAADPGAETPAERDRRRWQSNHRRTIVAGLERLDRDRRRMKKAIATSAAIRATRGGPAWEAASEAGLDLRPIAGLEPIGRDPYSGLWEFWHQGSGRRPERGSDGELLLDASMGIVLVLVPGGTFRMGHDEDQPFNRPAHEVSLGPFLLSKHEMTQGQWRRLAGGNPSIVGPTTHAALGISELHPVEGVGWTECRSLLVEHGLDLPSEAQWEYACRAGTDSLFWFPGEVEEIRRRANFMDRSFGRLLPEAPPGEAWDDGNPVHAPIGWSGRAGANRFGLHDMHGNVWEWCLDRFHENYVGAPVDGSAWRTGGDPTLVIRRGGAWSEHALNSTSAQRGWARRDFLQNSVGVRPSRPIDPTR